jgi:hypothetical protein
VALGHTGLASPGAAQQATKPAASPARLWLWARSRSSASLILFLFLNLSINSQKFKTTSKIHRKLYKTQKMQTKFF